MIDKHPSMIWTGVIVTLITLATGVAGGWYYLTDERARSVDQSERLADIRLEQEAIRKELATIAVTLATVEQRQADFDNLREEHLWLASRMDRPMRGMT